MSFVLDASATIPWFLDDEIDTSAPERLKRVTNGGALVPGLWHLEIGNVLLRAFRRGRITQDKLRFATLVLTLMPITVDRQTERRAFDTTFELAVRFKLTLYDAAYLELAERRRCPLATNDSALAGAALMLGVPLA